MVTVKTDYNPNQNQTDNREREFRDEHGIAGLMRPPNTYTPTKYNSA